VTALNRQLAIRWFEEVWNQRRRATIHELVAPAAAGHLEGQEIAGSEEFSLFADELLNALPDLAVTIEDVVADEENAVVRWRFHGTHKGKGMGLEPTGREVFCSGMTWLKFREGKIVEGWDRWNHGAFVQQLTAPVTTVAAAAVE